MTKSKPKNQDLRIDEKKAKKVAEKIDNLVKEAEPLSNKYLDLLIELDDDATLKNTIFDSLVLNYCNSNLTTYRTERYLSRGYKDEKFKQGVVSILQDLEEILPRHDYILLRSIVLSDSEEDTKEKIKLLLELEGAGVHTDWVNRQLGDLYAKLDDPDNSIKYYEKHLEDHKDIKVNYLVAEQYHDKGKIEEALSHYKKAIEFCYETHDIDYIDECFDSIRRIFYIHLYSYTEAKDKEEGRKYLYDAYQYIKKWYDIDHGAWDVDEYERYISRLEKLADAALKQDDKKTVDMFLEMKQWMGDRFDEISQEQRSLEHGVGEVSRKLDKGFSLVLKEITSIKKQSISIDEKIDKLDRQILQKYEKKDYPETESKLKQELGFWDQLEPNSKRFMTTAEFLLKDMEEGEFDFSVINLEYSKIMETELNNKLILKIFEESQEDREEFLSLDAKKDEKTRETRKNRDGKILYWSKVSLLLDDKYKKYKHLTLGQINTVVVDILKYPNDPKNQFLMKFFEKHIKNWDFVENELYSFPRKMAEIYRNGSVHMECKEKTVAENCRKETIEFLLKFYKNLKSM